MPTLYCRNYTTTRLFRASIGVKIQVADRLIDTEATNICVYDINKVCITSVQSNQRMSIFIDSKAIWKITRI